MIPLTNIIPSIRPEFRSIIQRWGTAIWGILFGMAGVTLLQFTRRLSESMTSMSSSSLASMFSLFSSSFASSYASSLTSSLSSSSFSSSSSLFAASPLLRLSQQYVHYLTVYSYLLLFFGALLIVVALMDQNHKLGRMKKKFAKLILTLIMLLLTCSSKLGACYHYFTVHTLVFISLCSWFMYTVAWSNVSGSGGNGEADELARHQSYNGVDDTTKSNEIFNLLRDTLFMSHITCVAMCIGLCLRAVLFAKLGRRAQSHLPPQFLTLYIALGCAINVLIVVFCVPIWYVYVATTYASSKCPVNAAGTMMKYALLFFVSLLVFLFITLVCVALLLSWCRRCYPACAPVCRGGCFCCCCVCRRWCCKEACNHEHCCVDNLRFKWSILKSMGALYLTAATVAWAFTLAVTVQAVQMWIQLDNQQFAFSSASFNANNCPFTLLLWFRIATILSCLSAAVLFLMLCTACLIPFLTNLPDTISREYQAIS